jgi:hypothetical protein
MNALYLAAVKNDAQITAIDTWQLFADAAGDAPVSEFPDLLHPNQLRLCEMGGGPAPGARNAPPHRHVT